MPLPGPIVDASWLASNLTNVAIADVRWSLADGPKLDAYVAGHIPGAVFVDLDAELSAPPGVGGRHPLPPATEFVGMLAEKGLLETPVVCYDDVGGGVAARMWWMLDVLGYEAAVLNGGLMAWSGPLDQGTGLSGTCHDGYQPSAAGQGVDGAAEAHWPNDRLATANDVTEAVETTKATIVDARSPERFAGTPNPIDDPPGHMPGARSRPWQANLNDDMTFRSFADIAQELADTDSNRIEPWIATCGSGVTACHNLLAARAAGVEDGRLYVGSWSQWSQDPGRPIAQDSSRD